MKNMRLSNFESNFNTKILKRGQHYYDLGRVADIKTISESEYKINVQGTKLYTVLITLKDNGDITKLSCNCPYSYNGLYCKHEAAVLYKFYNTFDMKNKAITEKNIIDDDIRKIINIYNEKNEINAKIQRNISNVHLYPIVYKKKYKSGDIIISVEIKIGEKEKKRIYVINDVYKFIERFRYKKKYRYGKELEIIHSNNILDEESRVFMNYIKFICEKYSSSYYNKKSIKLKNDDIFDFFKLYIGKSIFFEGELFDVVLNNYPIKFSIEKDKKDYYILTNSSQNYDILSFYPNLIIVNYENKTIYICTDKYSEAMSDILKFMEENGNELFISNKYIQPFYKSILSIISNFCKIENINIINHLKPPELRALIYLNTENNSIQAKLVFNYDKDEYDAYNNYNNPIADIGKEVIIKNAVEKYFEKLPNNKDYNLILHGDDKIYDFIIEGIKELSQEVEIFASENFRKIIKCKKMPLSIGVNIESNLIELEFDVENYSRDELLQIFESYNKGLKYHRLKTGEFISLNSGFFEEFAELKDAFNINKENILNGKIEVPKYRMLYLDTLSKNNNELNINESRELYKEIKKYKTLSDVGDFNISNELDNIMRQYQKDGFRWLKTIYKYNFGGILADDMGLGKTLQAIALIQSINEEDNNKKFLVVCPSSLVLNWENEIKKFAPNLKSLALIGGDIQERKEKMKKILDYDIIITSYNLIIKDIKIYKKIQFCIHFIDEAQYIKNHNTQTAQFIKLIKSETRLALTGTPIENNLAELWSIFDFIMPGYLHQYKYFKNTFEIPIIKHKDINKTKALQKIVAPFMLRRMKKEVLKELPDKTEIILKSEMYDMQRKIYIANLINFKKEAKEETELGGEKSRFKVLAMLTKLRQLCCDPSLIYNDYNYGSAKLEQCIELILNGVESGHKILLFSQFTSMLDIIKERLDNENISNYMLTGKTRTSERLNMADKFNNNNTNVFLISLKAGGTGLNLTGADIVIHYDPWWNISAENQASDRVYRIGQRKNVQIYKLISKDTIEEKILSLQEAKSKLMEITQSNENIMKMPISDILNLFE